MKRLFLSVAIFAGLLFTSSVAMAGPDEDLRDASLSKAARLRSEGWPKERCYAGLRFYNSTVTEGNGVIIAGDKLISIDSNNVENATAQQVADTFGSIPPNSKIVIQVNRGGLITSLDLVCGNLADIQRAYLQGLDFAAKKKWTECIDALAGRPNDPEFLNLRASCARVSRKFSAYPVQQWMDQAMRSDIEMGAYAPPARRDLALRLLKSRIEISPAAYDSLVENVRAWDNGKTWDQVQPNYLSLRRSVERGVKARLIDPQSAIIEMPYDFIYGSWTPAFSGTHFEGFMTCGTVNAKNRMGGYTGATYFISVVDDAGMEKYTGMDDTTSAYFRPVEKSCSELIKKLKYIGSDDGIQSPTDTRQPPTLSISQELENLARLHDSGALTDQEYAAAKARILSGH